MRADLTRRSVGLTDAHRALITLLAEIAVADYLREIEATSPGSQPSIHCEAREA